MKRALIILGVLISVQVSLSQARYVTLTIKGNPGNASRTNEFFVGPAESVELVSHPGSVRIGILKDDIWFYPRVPDNPYPSNYNWLSNYTFAGPARCRLTSDLTGYIEAFATFRITPEAFPPDRTLIVAPGTNRVAVSLECSTNLATWVATTNGVYGSPTEAKFFRIKAEKAP